MGFFDDFLGKSANQANKDRYESSLTISRREEGLANEYFQRFILPQLKGALGEVDKGFTGAMGEVGRMGSASKQSALDREQRNLGGAQQGLASRGLGNTTLSANLTRGVQSDTQRSLAAIDEALAGLSSQLMVGRGQARAGAMGDIAGAYQGQLGTLLDILRSRRGTVEGRTDEPGFGLQQLFGAGSQLGMMALL